MVATQPWNDLQEGFLDAVCGEDQTAPADWHDVWALIVADEWYQRQLAACARKLVARQCAKSDWLDDVQQEAMTLLARQLRKWPDLRVDPERARWQFAPWMRGIINHTCQEALRHLRRKRKPLLTLHRDDFPDRRAMPMAQRVELSLAIDELSEPARTVVALRFKGFNCREIAGRLSLDYEVTRSLFNRAMKLLRAEWGE